MRIPFHPDYNLRWMIVIAAMFMLLLAFVASHIT